MDCDVCSREFSARRKAICPSCVQASLYERRLHHVTALLEKEKSHTHAEAVVRPGNDGIIASLPADADFDAITCRIKSHSSTRVHAETLSTDHLIDQITEKAEELKRQIEGYKTSISTQQEANEHRRQALAAQREELAQHKPKTLEPILSTTRRTLLRLDKVRNRITDARILLCREAAGVSNLQRHKSAVGRYEYTLGGISIPDLWELGMKTQPLPKITGSGPRTVAEPYELVSGSMDNVARLLNIAAHYLSVRLPAEIIIPHEDFPRAVVMLEKSSYRLRDIPFPGSSSSQASSPAASRILDRNAPRPRNLWLHGSLAQLFKDDPKSFAMYLEGVMLLAWDLAWLCKSQGFDNINSFEDVSAVGRNLWQLLHRKPQRPILDRRGTQTSTRDDADRDPRLGQFSHNSVYKNLASAEGRDPFKDWKMLTSTRLIDKLKSYLVSEISGAEWDLLEEKEWDEEREDEKAVLVGGSRVHESKYAAMSVMSIAPREGQNVEKTLAPATDRRESGNSGWMKVRGRADAS